MAYLKKGAYYICTRTRLRINKSMIKKTVLLPIFSTVLFWISLPHLVYVGKVLAWHI